MKKLLGVIMPLILAGPAFTQQESFDLFTYTAPKGYTKEKKENVVAYTFINKQDKSWCQLGIFKSTASKGNIDADFNSEWETLVAKQYHTTEPPSSTDNSEAEGWKIKSGVGKYMFEKKETAVLLTTFSGHGVCISIVATTANQRYFSDVEALMTTLELKTPVAVKEILQATNSNTNQPAAFSFNTTNFDDGWISVIKEDWVEVSKNNIKVFLHYPKQGTIFSADPDPLIRAAWNILVAPRYSHLRNFKTTYITSYERVYLGFGTATSNGSGKEVYIVLFRQAGGWIELVAPDKNSFIKTFNIDPETIAYDTETEIVKPLRVMEKYNKFAIAAADFTGKWNDRFSSNTYYTNVYTGNSAGMSTYTSTQSFEFAGNRYNWHLVGANSYGGRSEFGQAKGNGTFKILNNWQIYFSEMEGKPKTYDAYFSAVKGGRILWINDAANPGSGIYTGFSKQ